MKHGLHATLNAVIMYTTVTVGKLCSFDVTDETETGILNEVSAVEHSKSLFFPILTSLLRIPNVIILKDAHKEQHIN